MDKTLISKYNIPGPRYTSYPPVPSWNQKLFPMDQWKWSIRDTFNDSNQKTGISLYIHLPFCESLCTYCGCNTRITVNHAVERPYLESLLKEWQLYLDLFEEQPRIAEIHLGGGTPTFFSPQNLKYLIDGISKTSIILPDCELGFEAHPNSTSLEHLQTLYALGFKRLSLGIQDFDPKVQRIVNRIQSFEVVKGVMEKARNIGYTSINFDLIYGLPLQTKKTVSDTIRKVAMLKPDRIAFYSYAHVPWIKPGQRMFTEMDLPDNETKRGLYELGRKMLEDIGYHEIGMDHFALPTDGLHLAEQKGHLHRNFMGYTTSHTKLLVGLGASSISDTWNAYAQNVKTIEQYQQIVEEGMFPIFKGHLLSKQDVNTRKHISNLMCRSQTAWVNEKNEAIDIPKTTFSRLVPLAGDGVISLESNRIQILPQGRPFIRNVCMAIDPKLWDKQSKEQVFSKVI